MKDRPFRGRFDADMVGVEGVLRSGREEFHAPKIVINRPLLSTRRFRRSDPCFVSTNTIPRRAGTYAP